MAFNAFAPEELKLALLMGLWTGQRKGDLLSLRWSAYQRKTGRRAYIPAAKAVREALANSDHIADNPHQYAWQAMDGSPKLGL
ncbi:hypothetical protein BTE77_08295 [Ensifer adhaerens]|nr:hypothetical protein BTE77_08295 [Ensifer adhaerens]